MVIPRAHPFQIVPFPMRRTNQIFRLAKFLCSLCLINEIGVKVRSDLKQYLMIIIRKMYIFILMFVVVGCTNAHGQRSGVCGYTRTQQSVVQVWENVQLVCYCDFRINFYRQQEMAFCCQVCYSRDNELLRTIVQDIAAVSR